MVIISYLNHLFSPLILVPVLSAIVMVFAVLLLATFSWLLIYKVISNNKQKRDAATLATYKVELENFRGTGLAFPWPSSYHDIITFFTALGDIVRKEGALPSVITDALSQTGIPAQLIAAGRSRSWPKRYVAYHRLGEIELPALKDHFAEAAQREQDRRVFAVVMMALARLVDSQEALHQILLLAQSGPKLSASYNEGIFTQSLRALIRHRGTDVVLSVLQDLLLHSFIAEPDLSTFVAAMGNIHLVSVSREIESLWEKRPVPPALKMAALRSLADMAVASPCYMAGLTDDDWQVRAVAAKSARFGGESAVQPLKRLVGDSSYNVRMNAADSLAHLGAPGRIALDELSHSPDPFIRDVAQFAIACGV